VEAIAKDASQDDIHKKIIEIFRFTPDTDWLFENNLS
jgi:hypothetical protein